MLKKIVEKDTAQEMKLQSEEIILDKKVQLRTIIHKKTGQEIRAQFDEIISDEEMIIDALRTEVMENPHWDFEKQVFYDKPIEIITQ
jgi:hypothetical protein